MRKFIFFVIIFGIILAIAGFLYWNKNPFSKEILKLEILGPSETEAAKEIEYTVKYKNNGNIKLEEAKLVFEFPENTLLEEDQKRIQEIGPEKLGDIYPGEEKVFTFKARLLGREGEVKIAKASLSYQPKNLKASYESTTSLATVIKSLPITFDFDIPSKVQPQQDFKLSLNYFSRLDYPLSNLEVKIDYPDSFEFLWSNPKSLDKTQWEIPLLNKAEGGRIEIKGKLKGEIKEQKIFSSTLGIWLQDNFVPLKEISVSVTINKADLFIFQQINGKDKYTANPGDILHYEIFFRNTSKEPFENMFLVVYLEGRAFDFESIKTNLGKFNKEDNSITFDWQDVPKLRFLAQEEEGKVEFWINIKNEWQTSPPQEKNFIVRDNVLLSGVEEEFETKINSKLVILQQAIYQDEVFGNSGPFPPKPGQTTTYTVYWQAKNYYNDVKNVKVKATLPSNVSLTGEIFPETKSSKFSFDSVSREAVWTVTDGEKMSAGTGVLNEMPSIYFQVSLTPRSNADIIIGQARIIGEDQWTEEIIEGASPAINTNLVLN